MIFTTDTKRQVKRYISYNYTPKSPPASIFRPKYKGRPAYHSALREGEWAPFIQIMI